MEIAVRATRTTWTNNTHWTLYSLDYWYCRNELASEMLGRRRYFFPDIQPAQICTQQRSIEMTKEDVHKFTYRKRTEGQTASQWQKKRSNSFHEHWVTVTRFMCWSWACNRSGAELSLHCWEQWKHKKTISLQRNAIVCETSADDANIRIENW